MIAVKLPARGGWLCGDCGAWYRRHHQVRDCCSEDDGYSVAEYVGAVVLVLCAMFFILPLLIRLV